MLTSVAIPVISKRYILQEQLGSGGMGSVYRALDRLTGQPVALKQVLSPTEYDAIRMDDSLDFRLALAQEFKILASLRHPNIISVIDYGFDEQHRPFYTMDLVENAQTILQAGQNQPLQAKIELLVQTLRALAYLHRRGILHRDLKPANILVADNQLKVLDFGLSTTRNDDSTSTSGTVAYMAPEMLRGDPTSEAADFYAVGVIAYELLAGQHPFDTSNITKLMEQILTGTPNMQPLHDAVDGNEKLPAAIGLLLSTHPEDRFGSAEAIIEVLGTATGQEFARETAATRESFLQAAQFVGRETEFKHLSDSLDLAISGKGTSWLIGGESGVGKSRLLDELRTLALVHGAVVLRGQAIGEGSRTYQVWRDVLRSLCLLSDLTPLEASVLRPLVPDIATLTDMQVPDVPELDADATQDRLFSIIEEIFRRQQQPLLVILEDLHWSHGESIALFVRLASHIKDLPVLIVGSYRSDEAPTLPAQLPDVQLMKLNRLSEESIAALSESMLGEAGRQQQVVDWLHRETEGNVFFLVEVVRAVAEEVGQLDRIGSVTLPNQIFAGGIARIIERRLRQVPTGAYPLLQLAAVLGRELEPDVLHSADQATDITQWLVTCAESAVIEIQNERWSFAHDKLREALVTDLSLDQRRDLHRTAALAIEAAYPNAEEQAERLVYYWNIAGDTTKESHYAGMAGLAAMKVGAYRHAQVLLERALTLSTAPQDESQRLQLGRWETQLADAYLAMGRLDDCMLHTNKAIHILDHPMPGSKLALAASIPWQAVNMWIARFRRVPAVRRPAMFESTEGLKRVVKVSIASTNLLTGLYGVLRLIGIAARVEALAELAMGQAFLATIAGYAHLKFIAQFSESQVKRALPFMAENTQERGAVLSLMGLYYLVNTRWAEMERTLKEAIEVHRYVGDRANMSIAILFLASGYFQQGQFTEGSALCREIMDGKFGNAMLETGALGGLALQSMLADEPTEVAEEFITQAASLKTTIGQTSASTEQLYWGALTRLHLTRGDLPAAREAAASTLKLLSASRFWPVIARDAFRGIIEVSLADFEAAPQRSAERLRYAVEVRQRLQLLRRFAHACPIGQPYVWLYQGRYEWLLGHKNKALAAWRKSLVISQHLKAPYEQGLAHFDLGQHLIGAEAQEHLAQAAAIFERIGAFRELNHLRAVTDR